MAISIFGASPIISYPFNKYFYVPIILYLYAAQGDCKELLGRISDDTAPVQQERAVAADNRRIIYRVICSPEGEQLPDCEKPLVDGEAKGGQASESGQENSETPAETEKKD